MPKNVIKKILKKYKYAVSIDYRTPSKKSIAEICGSPMPKNVRKNMKNKIADMLIPYMNYSKRFLIADKILFQLREIIEAKKMKGFTKGSLGSAYNDAIQDILKELK